MIRSILKSFWLGALAFLLFPAVSYASGEERVSQTVIVSISVAIAVGVITAYILYKASFAKKEVSLELEQGKKRPPSGVSSAIREKIEKIPLKTTDPETTIRALSKIVEEEAEFRSQDFKQQYSVKYQMVVQEKNREVETVKKEYHAVKEKYEASEKMFKRTEAEKKTTEAVVRSIAEGLVVVNEKGEVLLMNPSAEKLLGVPKEKKVGKSILEDLGAEHLISMSRNTGDSTERITEYTTKDENVKKIIRSSSAIIQNEDGQTVGMVNVLTDVTKQRELDDIKNRFVSNVTHELRTPIVAMQKAIEILLDKSSGPPLSDIQANFLNIVARNLAHLSRLVEDLLDIAKIESGKMRLKFVLNRIDKLVSDACDALGTWAKSKDIQIVREIDKSLPEMTLDPVKITQVLNNLIGNAIKFTPRGGTITVRNTWASGNAFAEVSVADTGVGIAKENLSKLFGRFEQFGDQQGISGTGLGLCIAKEIVERHGGTILVESAEKKGSKFTFTIPIKQQTLGGTP